MGIHLYCCISNGKGGLMNDGKHEYSQSISERKEQRGNEKTVNFFCANDCVYINFIWSCCYRCNRKYVYHSYHHDKDRKSTRLNSSHVAISYAVFCLKKKIKNTSYK